MLSWPLLLPEEGTVTWRTTHTDLSHRGGSKRKQFPHAGCFIRRECYVGITGLFSQEGKRLEYMNNQARDLSSWLVCLGWSSIWLASEVCWVSWERGSGEYLHPGIWFQDHQGKHRLGSELAGNIFKVYFLKPAIKTCCLSSASS